MIYTYKSSTALTDEAEIRYNVCIGLCMHDVSYAARYPCGKGMKRNKQLLIVYNRPTGLSLKFSNNR